MFPRCGHLSVGICGKGEPAPRCARAWSITWPSAASRWKGATFYSHLLPSLETAAGRSNRVAGEGWMAVGDAAGLVDPITGEGLYYAIRSGDLAARSCWTRRSGWPRKLRHYRRLLRRDFAADLEFGSRWPSASFWAASCSTPCPRAWCSSRAAARASARDAGPVRRHAALPGIEAPPVSNLGGTLYEVLQDLLRERAGFRADLAEL